MMPELQRINYDKQAAYEYWSARVAPVQNALFKITNLIFEENESPAEFEKWLRTEEGDRFRVRHITKVHYGQLNPNDQDYESKLNGMSKQQVNNAIFDIQWGIITNEASQIKLFNPGSFDVQKKASRIVTIAKLKDNNYTYEELMSKSLDELDALIPKETVNILDATTQLYFFKQNMTAGKLIGVFANANVSHVFCSLLDIDVNLDFKFNGKSYKDAKWDPIESVTGRFVSKNIAGYVGAAVDAVKDPVFAKMNINMNTVNAALVLIRLGVNPEEIALLTSQPIIEEFSKRMDAAKDESSYVDSVEIMFGLLHEYTSDENLEQIIKSLSKNDFDAESLFNNIKNEDKDVSIKVGALFAQLLLAAEDMRAITYCTKFNSVTNAPGPLFTDNIYSKAKVDKFLSDAGEGLTIFNNNTADIIEKNPILNSIYKATIDTGNIVSNIASLYWKYESRTFKAINKKLTLMLGRPIKGDKLEYVYQDYILFCLNKAGFTNNTDMVNLITKFPDKYIETIRKIEKENPELYERELKYNPFIQRVHRATPTEKFPISTLTLESGKLGTEVAEELRDGWTALVKSDNDEIRELGITLFLYNLYRSGFKFNPKSFLHLASTDVKYAVYNYISILNTHEIFELKDPEIYDFVVQYNRNHPNELLPNRDSLEYTLNSTGGLMVGINNSDIIINASPFGIQVQPIIKYNWNLYVAKKASHSVGTTEIEYVAVDRLGFENDVVEYIQTSKHNVESVIIPAVNKTKANNDSSNKKTTEGLLSEGMVEKKNTVKQAEQTEDGKDKRPKLPSQLTEEDVNKLLPSLSEDAKEFLQFYSINGILNTTMSAEEMIKKLYDSIPDLQEALIDPATGYQAALKAVHNEIINKLKDVC